MFILPNKVIPGLNVLHITSLLTIKSRKLAYVIQNYFQNQVYVSPHKGCFCHFLDNSATSIEYFLNQAVFEQFIWTYF
jgi:hypothetical protein